MSPAEQLIAMQPRLNRHNAKVTRLEQAQRRVDQAQREGRIAYLTTELYRQQREYTDALQIEYDQRFIKVDGREG